MSWVIRSSAPANHTPCYLGEGCAQAGHAWYISDFGQAESFATKDVAMDFAARHNLQGVGFEEWPFVEEAKARHKAEEKRRGPWKDPGPMTITAEMIGYKK